MGKVSIVAVLVGPHHAADWTCRAWGDLPGLTLDGFGPHQHCGELCMSRVGAGIALAQSLGAELVVCGDSNEGRDVAALVGHAQAMGVVAEGVHKPHSNTSMDAESAVRFAVQTGAASVDLYLVTDWWHLPRAWVHARRVSREVFAGQVRIRPHPAFGWIPPLKGFYGELRGIVHALLGRPHNPLPGPPLGKPDAAKVHRAASNSASPG